MSQKTEDGLGPLTSKQPQGTNVPPNLVVGDKEHESVLPTSFVQG